MGGNTRTSRIWKPLVGECRLYLDGWMLDAGHILESYIGDDPTSPDMTEVTRARVWVDHDMCIHVDNLRDPIAAEIIRNSVEPNLDRYLNAHDTDRPVDWTHWVDRYVTMSGDKAYLSYRDTDYCMERSSWMEHTRHGNVYWDGRNYLTDVDDEVLGSIIIRILEDCRA